MYAGAKSIFKKKNPRITLFPEKQIQFRGNKNSKNKVIRSTIFQKTKKIQLIKYRILDGFQNPSRLIYVYILRKRKLAAGQMYSGQIG